MIDHKRSMILSKMKISTNKSRRTACMFFICFFFMHHIPHDAFARTDAGNPEARTKGVLGSLLDQWFSTEASESVHGRSMLAATPQIMYGNSEVPAWRGRLDTVYGRSYFAPAIYQNSCRSSSQDCSLMYNQTYPYEQYELDPTGSGRPVMRISYPAGSWSPGSPRPGGTLFYAYPYKISPSSLTDPFSRHSAYLEYEVYFPEDFDFVKGGKLPGLSGGESQGRGCGGGADPDRCFSYRVMWRRNGAGEAYVYVPEGRQSDTFCDPRCSSNDEPCTVCNFNAGVSLLRGAFYFQRGAWTKLRLGITLNTVGQTDGKLTLEVNGETAIQYDDINWRERSDIFVEGINFSSWFGGGDSSWAPQNDTYVLLRNFRAYYDGPVTALNQISTSKASNENYGTVGAQIVEEGFVDEP